VWRAPTQSALIAEWLMQNDFEPKVGHHFIFRAAPAPGWTGVTHCEVWQRFLEGLERAAAAAED
jgi:uncharacterized protein YndB with AHSA1/START domain